MSYDYRSKGRPRYPSAGSTYGRSYYSTSSSQYPTGYGTEWSREPLSGYHTSYADGAAQQRRFSPYNTAADQSLHAPSYSSTSSSRPNTETRRSYSKRVSWPPSPSVESETESLAKEVNPPRPIDSNDVPLRGTADQEPTLLGPFTLDRHGNLVSDTESDLSSGGAWSDLGISAVDSSSRPQQARSKQTLGSDSVLRTPRFSAGTPDPQPLSSVAQTFSRNSSKSAAPATSAAIVSPDARNAEKKRRAFVDECLRSDALRGDGKPRSGPKVHDRSSDVSSSEPTTDDDWVDVRKAAARTAAPYSMTGRDLKQQASKSSNFPPKPAAVDSRQPAPGSDPGPRQEPRTDSRRHADTLPPRPQHGLGIRAERPPPIKPSQFAPALTTSPVSTPTSRLSSAGNDYLSFHRAEGGNASRPHSPALSGTAANSVSNSPRASREIPPSAWQPPRSRPVSRESSRPSSPHQVDEGTRRSVTFGNAADDRPKRTSRLLSSTNTSELENFDFPVRNANALPYPVDDSILAMPSELDHQYRPAFPEGPLSGHQLPYRDNSARSSRQSSIASDSPVTRPRPTSRHTVDFSVPTAGTLATSAVLASAMAAEAPRPRDSGIGVVSREPPPCPRAHSTRDYDDWYTISGCTNFDICPDCLSSYFGSSPLRKHFKRQRRKDSNQKTKCDFASPWMRHAFVLTTRQRLDDLDMIRAVSDANAAEQSCTGDRHDQRRWYTLRDRNGEPLNTPLICPRDVRKMRALFPALEEGVFVRSPYAGQRGKCDMRASAIHFPEAIRLLTDIDADAASRRRRPQMAGFLDLLTAPPPPPPPPPPSHPAEREKPSPPLSRDRDREHHAAAAVAAADRPTDLIPACPRDNPRTADDWHICSHLPDFTVCQACYSALVWPAIADGSKVASQFGQTPVRIRPTNSRDPRGATCQLYSERMRGYWRRAVERNDFELLAGAATKRKAAEVRLFTEVTRAERDAEMSEGERARVRNRVRSEWIGVWE